MTSQEFQQFRRSEFYQDIKLKCGLPPTSHVASPNWNLVRGLFKREQGLASTAINGTFTCGQKRSITNLYPPNHWSRTIFQTTFFNGIPTDKINVCRFDESGNQLIVSSLHQTSAVPRNSNRISLFNSENNSYKLKKTLWPSLVEWALTDVDISRCGQLVAYSTFSQLIFVKPIDESQPWQSLRLPNARENQLVMPLYFSPCSKQLVGSYKSVSLFILDIESQAVQTIPLVREFDANFMSALSILSNRNPNLYACAHSNSGLVDIFDSRTSPQLVKTIWCHADGITSIDSRNDGNYILTNSKDNSARIWDIRKTSCGDKVYKKCENFVMSFQGHSVVTFQQPARFSPLELTGQRYIYCGCSLGKVVIYDVLSGQIKEKIPGHRLFVNTLEWHPKRNEIISGSWDGSVHLNVYKPAEQKVATVPIEDVKDSTKEKDETFWSELHSIG